MDRSFLSHADVIAASRQFVCLRLLTYENADEARFLKALWVGRSGEVENTLFTILSPDGKRMLAAPGRSPGRGYGDAGELAAGMKRIGRQFAAAKAGTPSLPQVASVRLALNVGACDQQPVVVFVADDMLVRQQLQATLASLAWADEFIGRHVYAAAASVKDLATVTGVEADAGVLVIQADRFGRTGKVLAQLPATATRERIADMLRKGVTLYERGDRSFGEHIFQGRQQGVFWDTVVPVTDPRERQARQEGRPPPP